MILTVLFALTGIIIVIILANKVIEMRKDKPTFLSQFLSRFDVKSEAFMASARTGFRHRVRGTTTFVTDMPKNSMEKAQTFRGKVQDKYRSIVPDVRGKRVLKGDRNPSDFLDQIKRDRGAGREGTY